MRRFAAAIFGTDGPRLGAEERAFFRDTQPFGFILFDRNIEDAAQLRALCTDLRDAVGWEAPITIDQEGGRVQRLRPPLARDWLPPLKHAARAGPDAARALYLRYRLIAHELRALGIDSNCAPMADIAFDHTHRFLRNRCYGDTVAAVIDRARAVADAHLDGGVLPILKHMPGHGRAATDSHVELPRVTAPIATLAAEDFAPFKALNDLPLGMTAHVVYEALDAEPATLSRPTMAHIRDAIGFDGLIMTDDIGMKALSGGMDALCRRAIEAGCNLILHCNGPMPERRVVAEAAGQMSDAAQTRAEAALAARRAPGDVDIPALEAELETLMGGQVYG